MKWFDFEVMTRPQKAEAYSSTSRSRVLFAPCLKNDIDVAHYNFDADQPILIIFGRNVAEGACYQLLSHLS